MIRNLTIPTAANVCHSRGVAGAEIITWDSQEDVQLFDENTLALLRLGEAAARVRYGYCHPDQIDKVTRRAHEQELHEAKLMADKLALGKPEL